MDSERETTKWTCKNCGNEFTPKPPKYTCPKCGSTATVPDNDNIRYEQHQLEEHTYSESHPVSEAQRLSARTQLKWMRYAAVTLLLATTITASIYYIPLLYFIPAESEKTLIVNMALEHHVKSAPDIGTLLIVNNSISSEVEIPPEFGGVPVRFITWSQLNAMDVNSTTLRAVVLKNIELDNFWSGRVVFQTGYNSYWPGWNTWCSYEYRRFLFGWYLEYSGCVSLV